MKIGDFGLATSSLAAPSEMSEATPFKLAGDMTLDIGTRLYTAPVNLVPYLPLRIILR